MTKKSQTNPFVLQTEFHALLSDFATMRLYLQMVQSMVTQLDLLVLLHLIHKCRVSDNVSIFSAESKAIDLALNHIKQSRNTNCIIFSDFLPVRQSLLNRHIENFLLLAVLWKYNGLADFNNVFVGFPVTLGLKATTKTEIAAKLALIPNISDLKISFTDFKPC